VNLLLADGGADFRARHQATLDRCWKGPCCQVCDRSVGRPAVLFGGPEQLRSGRFDEPPLCTPCAVYASKACPMIAGRQARFADRARLAEGRRGKRCPDPDCGCAGWTSHDTGHGQAGKPAHPWYAVYIAPDAYAITVHDEQIRCSDGGCTQLHTRRVVNGGQLTAPPLKVVLVSEPGAGRIWRRLTDAETAALTDPDRKEPR
jgi:hypothetical protein